MLGSLGEQLSVVDPLSSRQDLLPPHEHVVGVGVFLPGDKQTPADQTGHKKVKITDTDLQITTILHRTL